MSAAILHFDEKYGSTDGVVTWRGRAVADASKLEAFLHDAVVPRLDDADDAFEDELRAAATTGMETEFVGKFLKAVPPPEAWEVGEVFAECILSMDSEVGDVVWPWNGRRDRKTPRASLPGADLVGLCRRDSAVFFLLGEVKTSSDASAPPGVMVGGGGMIWQLCENASRLDIQHALLKWLRCRCATPELRSLYREALSKFVSSTGSELLLIGVLVRDTAPNELDLKNRAKALAATIRPPAKAELHALYVPAALETWPGIVQVKP